MAYGIVPGRILIFRRHFIVNPHPPLDIILSAVPVNTREQLIPAGSPDPIIDNFIDRRAAQPQHTILCIRIERNFQMHSRFTQRRRQPGNSPMTITDKKICMFFQSKQISAQYVVRHIRQPSGIPGQ